MQARIALDFRLRQDEFVLEVKARLEARILALFGPSGCGKTTTLEAIAGLRPIDNGHIELGDRVLHCSRRHVNVPPRDRMVGYVPQDVVLFPHMNVRRNVVYGVRGANGVSLDRVLDILEIRPLIDREVSALSGGERQRVAIARALMSSPKLLLLDEPLAAVGAPLRRRIVPYLQRVRDELQVPMVYVTHDVEEARTIADQMIYLERGRVVSAGEPRSVLDRLASSSE